MLDVGDNLERAYSAVPEEALEGRDKDGQRLTAEAAVTLLISLTDGVKLTEKIFDRVSGSIKHELLRNVWHAKNLSALPGSLAIQGSEKSETPLFHGDTEMSNGLTEMALSSSSLARIDVPKSSHCCLQNCSYRAYKKMGWKSSNHLVSNSIPTSMKHSLRCPAQIRRTGLSALSQRYLVHDVVCGKRVL